MHPTAKGRSRPGEHTGRGHDIVGWLTCTDKAGTLARSARMLASARRRWGSG